MADQLSQFKKFVSEDEIEQKKLARQEEWEKVRKADDPVGGYHSIKAKKTHSFNSCIVISVYPLYIPSIKKGTEYRNN